MAPLMTEERLDVLTVTFPATLAGIDACCARATAFLLTRAVGSKDARFPLELLLREALTNAVAHGSDLDAARLVTLRMTVEPEGVTFEVADEGAGFNWREAMVRPLDPDREGGRGVTVYRQIADNVSFNEAGNMVTLTRHWRKGDGRA